MSTPIMPPAPVWRTQVEQQQQEGPPAPGEAPVPYVPGTVPTPAQIAAAINAGQTPPPPVDPAAVPAIPPAPAAPPAPPAEPEEFEEPLVVPGGQPIPFKDLDPGTQAAVRGLRQEAERSRLALAAATAAPPAPVPAPNAPEVTPPAPTPPVATEPPAPAVPAVDPGTLAAIVAALQAAGIAAPAAQAAAPGTAALAAAGTPPTLPAAPASSEPTPDAQLLTMRIAARPDSTGRLTVNGDALLNRVDFRTQLAALTEVNETTVGALITATATADPSVRINTAAASSGGALHSGTQPITPPAARVDAVTAWYAERGILK